MIEVWKVTAFKSKNAFENVYMILDHNIRKTYSGSIPVQFELLHFLCLQWL